MQRQRIPQDWHAAAPPLSARDDQRLDEVALADAPPVSRTAAATSAPAITPGVSDHPARKGEIRSLACADASAYAACRLRWSRKLRFPGLKREAGAHPLSGCKSGAAHATVSEPETAKSHCAIGAGRRGFEDFTSTREPGDRPETRTRRLALGDVRPVTISAYRSLCPLCTLAPSPSRRTWRV